MTIGIGFVCETGILLCSDTQVTAAGNHKFYECKLTYNVLTGLIVGTSYAGYPSLKKSFDGRFRDALDALPRPYSIQKIQNVIEGTLTGFQELKDDPMALNLLCAVILPDKDFRLFKTEGYHASEVTRFDYVGLGDCSVLRYLAPLLTQTRGYSLCQALNIGTYMIHQAKKYVDGCGGDTNVRIFRKDGTMTISDCHEMNEQRLLMLEHFLNRAATYFFDDREPESEFEDAVGRLEKALKDYRPEVNRAGFLLSR